MVFIVDMRYGVQWRIINKLFYDIFKLTSIELDFLDSLTLLSKTVL